MGCPLDGDGSEVATTGSLTVLGGLSIRRPGPNEPGRECSLGLESPGRHILPASHARAPPPRATPCHAVPPSATWPTSLIVLLHQPGQHYRPRKRRSREGNGAGCEAPGSAGRFGPEL